MVVMWARLSVETIFSRFFGVVRIDESNVDRYVALEPTMQAALVAVLGLGADECIVGMARYDRLGDDPTTAELSVLVEDAHQRRGIGTALLRHIADAAREDGVQALTGDVLATNIRMLRLLDTLGLRYQRRTEHTVIHAAFGRNPPTPTSQRSVATRSAPPTRRCRGSFGHGGSPSWGQPRCRLDPRGITRPHHTRVPGPSRPASAHGSCP